MITAVLPDTDDKPGWVELRVDGAHAARIWAHAVEVTADSALNQFHISLTGATGLIIAQVWAHAIQKAKA